MSDHTPPPWSLGTRNAAYVYLHAKQGPVDVCPARAHGLADAELIVRAVNAHAAMLSALKVAVHLYETYGLLAQKPGCGAWINSARDAIALAEKE